MNITARIFAITTIAATLALTGCSPEAAPQRTDRDPAITAAQPSTVTKAAAPNATEAFTKLAKSVTTAKLGTTVTAASDSNNLLGRPGQYTSKITFTDSRITNEDAKLLGGKDGVELGGAIEVFATAADAKTRADYLAKVTKAAFLAEQDFLHGTILIRVSRFLTPQQAAEYDGTAAGIWS